MEIQICSSIETCNTLVIFIYQCSKLKYLFLYTCFYFLFIYTCLLLFTVYVYMLD